MVEIKEIGKTAVDGTYEIEKFADDPFVARFLSPDPVIQSPGNAQNYNRYSYALNNPLKYTDPSGYKYRGADMGDNPGGFFNHGFKLPQNGTMGSGSHWSDGMMGEYYDFAFGSSKKFDAKYGVGAHNIGWSVWSDSYLAEKWRADDISIYDVETVEVFEVKTKTENWVGTEKNPYQILVSTDEVTSYELVVKGNDLNGEADDGDGLSMNDAGIMISAFGYSNFMKTELLKWGMKGADWGKAGANYLNLHLKAGKMAGYAGVGIYGFNSYSSFANGNNLQGVSNGLMSMYSFIATKGGIPGMVITAPFFAIDATIGMDNFILYNINYGIEQSNQIQNGNWGVSLWRPGRAFR
ncbi:MAG: hypothetical protein K9G61_08145 [Bacteroidales bacterium]|nr:hypothetical protein [Bacteroidales bacterium]